MRRRSSAAFACIRAGISSEKSSRSRSGISCALCEDDAALDGAAPLPPLAAGGGGGGGGVARVCFRLPIGIDGRFDRHENAGRIGQNVAIPESQNTIAL